MWVLVLLFLPLALHLHYSSEAGHFCSTFVLQGGGWKATGLALFLLRLRNHLAACTFLRSCCTDTNKQHSQQFGNLAKELYAAL